MGYIYILTNPSFPEYVKIGYAADVKQRLEELNRSTATKSCTRSWTSSTRSFVPGRRSTARNASGSFTP